MDEEFVRSTVRLSPDFHERVRVAIAKRRLRSFQQAVEDALNQWLGSPPAASPAAPQDLAKEEAREVSLFLDFLRNGEEGTVEMVRHALELYARKQRAQRKRSSA